MMPIPKPDVPTMFDERLAKFAETAPMPRLFPIIGQLRKPLSVAVVGRPGVGRDTVALALRSHGADVAGGGGGAADVQVLVIVEAIKPEERATAADGLPTLIVLNKADLIGSRSGGALPNAHRRAADVQRRTGIPTVAMVGLLAASTALWDELWSEVRPVELSPSLARSAGRLAADRQLRGADAVHLASALAVGDPDLVVAVWDRRLRAGAVAEHLIVAPQGDVE